MPGFPAGVKGGSTLLFVNHGLTGGFASEYAAVSSALAVNEEAEALDEPPAQQPAAFYFLLASLQSRSPL